MDRSFAGRLGLGSLTHAPARKQARRPARPRGASKRGSGANATRTIDAAIELLLRAPAGLARLLASGWALVRARKRLRIALIAALIALPLLGGGWLWLRHSSLVAVEHVKVSGVHGGDASAIEAALREAAKGMSTLDVQQGKLRAAVASYPVVGELRVHASFPHGLRIQVVEQPPVAVLSAGGAQTAVAADGVVLGTQHVSGALPQLAGPVQLTPGEHVRDAKLVAALTVLGAAPQALRNSTERAFSGSKGLTLVMHGGLRAYFGDATRTHAKWAALARVLADPGSAGATYVDVRVPERPAAGFPAGVAPPAVEGSGGEAASGGTGGSTESIAESLTSAAGGPEAAARSATSESEAESKGGSSEASGGSSEGEAKAGGEAEGGASEPTSEAGEGGGTESSG
ncbi:MAG TPA: FtsQ-type POTRA domain-containing protein [Solirubrobacteraceae bacterium]|nr:FtsQ-type POTRA domain-containing protein [Solirubrobacteraceae bacterium]